MTAEAVVGETLVATLNRGDDLEVRVRTLSVDGERFTDVREFVPSIETYGRGIMVPFDQTKPLMKALMDAARAG